MSDLKFNPPEYANLATLREQRIQMKLNTNLRSPTQVHPSRSPRSAPKCPVNPFKPTGLKIK